MKNKNVFLIKPVENKDDEDLFFTLYSKDSKIDIEILKLLKKHLGDDTYLILSLFEGITITGPVLSRVSNYIIIIKVYKEMKKLNGENNDFENNLKIVSEKLNLTKNQVFKYYNESRRVFDGIGSEIDENMYF